MTREEERLLRERYAEERNGDLARELGVSIRTVARWAKSLGLRKSERLLAEIRMEGQRTVEWMRLCGKRAGGVKKGQGKATAGSFGKGHRWSKDVEEKRKKAIRETAWEERKRILHGEPRRTKWDMRDYGKKKVGGKWRKA